MEDGGRCSIGSAEPFLGPGFLETETLLFLLFALIAAVMIPAFLRLLRYRRLVRRMQAVSEGLKRLGEGDLSFRFDATLRAQFPRLAGSFNVMAEKLESSVKELRETRDYFEGIVENSADIIVTVSPEGYVYSFNRGAEEALGYSRNEVIGRSAEMLFPDRSERDETGRQLKGVENVKNYETHLVTKGGEVRDVILTLSRLRDPEGRTIGSFGIGKDVTEANRMREQILASEKFVAIGQAVAGIQHALKNMLNALKGGAYMVNIGLSKDKRDRLVEGWQMVEGAIRNLTSMSSHMLSYVKEWKPSLTEVDVAAMVREIEEMFRSTAEGKGVALSVEIEEPLPPVQCDARLVHSAVMDILSNALDACMEKAYPKGEKPGISIRARPEAENAKLVLAIRDNGCGMSEAVRKSVFLPFFSTKKSWGTGLGMALTARTIRSHGGEIELESEENVGTEFRIIVPTGGPGTETEGADAQEGAGR